MTPAMMGAITSANIATMNALMLTSDSGAGPSEPMPGWVLFMVLGVIAVALGMFAYMFWDSLR